MLGSIGSWAAHRSASWALRHRWTIAGLVGLIVVGAVLVGAGIGASVSGGGSDAQVRAACRALGYDVASTAGGAAAGYVPAPVDAVPVIPEGGAVDGFGPDDHEQIAVARAIVAAGAAAGVGTRGMVVAIATALQESGLRELEVGDRDSRGPFQQRPSQGWGTPEQVTGADFSARAFFGGPTSPHFDAGTGRASPGGLQEVPGWEAMPVTVAAQKVQRSAFPQAYAKHEARATRIVAALTDGATLPAAAVAGAPGAAGPGGPDPGAVTAGPTDTTTTDATTTAGTTTDGTTTTGTTSTVTTAGADGTGLVTAEELRASGFDLDGFCAAEVVTAGALVGVGDGTTIPAGTWTAPLASRITSEFGMRLHPVHGIWRLHEGTDFQAVTGTPLRAASDGVVAKVTWHASGGLMVVVDHPGGVQTWFLHLSRVLVTPGQAVTGGGVIALSGGTGTGTAPHLHFETRVDGVPVDPVTFMAQRGVDLRAAG